MNCSCPDYTNQFSDLTDLIKDSVHVLWVWDIVIYASIYFVALLIVCCGFCGTSNTPNQQNIPPVNVQPNQLVNNNQV